MPEVPLFPPIDEYTIATLSDFMSVLTQKVANLQAENYGTVYRGHGNRAYVLRSKIVRYLRGDTENIEYADDEELEYLQRSERVLLQGFQRQAVPYLNYTPQNILEWLAIGQHHGLATRLLDWSDNPLTALFFAVENAQDYDKDGVVWVFRGMALVETPQAQNLLELDKHLMNSGVSIYYPKHINPRFISQQGCFTVHSMASGYYWISLEAKYTTADRDYALTKISVPKSVKPMLRNELDRMGVNYHTLFPDLDGLSRKINWVHFEKFPY